MIELAARLTIAPPEADAPEAFRAHCELRNVGDEDVSINIAPLSSPSLALEIQDSRSEPVLLPPPPVPPAQIPVEQLPAGDTRDVEFSGFLPSWTAPGSYRARFRYRAEGDPSLFRGVVTSQWVAFTLAS